MSVHPMPCAIPLIVRFTTRRKLRGWSSAEYWVNGSEVRRTVHLAPGPVDTPMLHWNHWVLKEHGDPGFPTLVKDRCPSLYRAVFREGDWTALAAAQWELRLEDETARDVFGRYLHRRAVLAQTEEGITSPEIFAQYIANQMLVAGTGESGIVESFLTARPLRSQQSRILRILVVDGIIVASSRPLARLSVLRGGAGAKKRGASTCWWIAGCT